MIAHIKKNDTVKVLSGKDKGKQGIVLEVSPASSKALVKGVAVLTHHVKAKKQGDVAGIKKQESLIHFSKIMLVCNACHKPSRINSKQLETGKRVRVCNRCQQIT